MLSPCLANTGRTVLSTSARSAYLLRKCGLAAFLAAFSISAWADASAAKSAGVACSVFIIAMFLMFLVPTLFFDFLGLSPVRPAVVVVHHASCSLVAVAAVEVGIQALLVAPFLAGHTLSLAAGPVVVVLGDGGLQ